MTRRPNPQRSGKPQCAPTATPFAFATLKVCAMISGSPAWKPQATLAEVTIASSASSSPQV